MTYSYETAYEIESRQVSRSLTAWTALRDAYKTNRRPEVKRIMSVWGFDRPTSERLYDALKVMVDETTARQKKRLLVDYDHLCLNKHKQPIPEDAVWCMRPSLWENTHRLLNKDDRGACLGRFEFGLARNPYLMRRIEELRGKQLACCCMPKLCHTNILAFVANITPEKRTAWQAYISQLETPRTIISLYRLEHYDHSL